MLPVPPQVVGFSAVPAVKVGDAGSESVLVLAANPVQLFTVSEKLV